MKGRKAPQVQMTTTGQVGRPSKLNSMWDTYQIAYGLALLGATDEDLAAALGVDIESINRWKRKDAKFKKALKDGKGKADAQVAKSLFSRAKGYSHPDTRITVVRSKKGKRVQVVATPTVKYYPPDTTACIFWLKNRQRALWRDVTKHEVGGPDGAPIPVEHSLDLSSLTNEELDMVESLGIKLKGKSAS